MSLTIHHVGVVSGVLVVMLMSAPAIATAQQSAPQCQAAGSIAQVAELPEGSGLAASRKTAGRFWSHNDSGEPMLIALDSNGRVAGRLQISGAKVEDWEAVAVGPCSDGSCIYVADIGDNQATRHEIAIYRFVEPTEPGGSANVSAVIRATYPDGAHDAETLLLAPDGRLLIVTKGDTGPVALYRFPGDPGATTVRLERIGAPRDARSRGENDRITDGAVSPDGRWVVLRSTDTLMFYRAADLLDGNWREAGRVSVESLGEPQGEGVTFGPDNSVYLMSEGGGKKQSGTFARLSCTLEP
jgi:hypothetical protein